MKKTGIICEGFSFQMWKKIHQCEVNEGYRVASEIIKNAVQHDCKVIVFEHLGNLRPNMQKYSRRSNQKRAYGSLARGCDYRGDKKLSIVPFYRDLVITQTSLHPIDSPDWGIC